MTLHDWEHSKENIQPIRQGRDVETLSKLLNESHSVVAKDKQSFIREFESKIILAENTDDPLSIWISYIKCWQENHVSGEQNDLLNIYERCVRKFKDYEQYQQDTRYLRLWIEYANIVADPEDIYYFLLKSELCTKLSLFYESYAQRLEDQNNTQKAEEIFKLGIENKAQPLNRLKKKHEQFQTRVIEKMKTEEFNKMEPSIHSQRNVLQSKFINSANIPVQECKKKASFNKNKEMKTFAIFNDNENDFKMAKDNHTINPPIFKGRSKENQPKTSKWYQQKIPQNVKTAITKPSFQVYQDESEMEIKENLNHHAAALRPKKTQAGNLLNQNPLNNFYNDSDTLKEIRLYDIEQLMMDTLYEISPEELRAGQTKYQVNTSPRLQSKPPPPPSTELHSNNMSVLGEETSTMNLSALQKKLNFDTPSLNSALGKKSSQHMVTSLEDFDEQEEDNENLKKKIQFETSSNNNPEKITEHIHENQENFPPQDFDVENNEEKELYKLMETTDVEPLREIAIRVLVDEEEAHEIIENTEEENLDVIVPSSKNEMEYKTFADKDLQVPLRHENPMEEENLATCFSLVKRHYETKSGFLCRIYEKSPAIETEDLIQLQNCYGIQNEISSSRSSNIYLVAKASENDDFDDDIEVMKVFKEPTAWEFHISQKLHSDYDRAEFINIKECYLFSDKCISFMNYYDQGSLQDCVDAYKNENKNIQEELVVFYFIEMLKIIESLNEKRVLHGNFTSQNLLTRNNKDGNIPLTAWNKEGNEGWSEYGLVLIDFKKSLDLALYEDGSKFKGAACFHPSVKCPEMREGKEWTHQIDTYCVFCIVFLLLQGEEPEIVLEDGRWNLESLFINTTMNNELWLEVFDQLLNTPSDHIDVKFLRNLRNKMENYLLICPGSKKLGVLIRRQSIFTYHSRKK